MGLHEIEQKYRISGPESYRERLSRMRARRISSGKELNELYDLENRLVGKNSILRLRQTEGLPGMLTFKGPRLAGKFKKRVEVESPVDYRKMKKILELAGYSKIAAYRKIREEYHAGPVSVTLDKLPGAGWFLEIEGKPSEILRYEKKLGLEPSDREPRSYLEITGSLSRSRDPRMKL